MLQLQDITLHRGDRLLFDNLNLVVHAGQHVSLVGSNGAGKSTLFQMVLQQLLPEEGDVKLPGSWRVVHLAQEAPASDQSALDYVLDGHAELRKIERDIQAAAEAGDDLKQANLLQSFEDLDGYRAEANASKILHGLGFAEEELSQAVADFSGGWRVRLALAQALMTPADLLLLDEPTNHLDMEATLWLERWLANFPGTLITIAHDRDFLDRATRYTAHLEHGQIQSYNGNYSSFEIQLTERANLLAAQNKKTEAKRKHLQSFVDRFRAKATKAKQAQSRLKALEKLGASAVVQAQHDFEFGFSNAAKVSKPLLAIEEANLGYPEATILQDVSVVLDPGARIGVLGKNGAGKSTLLKTLAGELDLQAGDMQRGKHSRVGYFAQHQMELLDDRTTALQTLLREHGDRYANETIARSYLGGWGFSGDDVNRPVKTFSGGERARLVLSLIAATEPALLILDEPTNHLDLNMRQALAFALQEFSGAMLLVSHDRHLLRQCVDELWLVADGTINDFPQDLDAYERGDFPEAHPNDRSTPTNKKSSQDQKPNEEKTQPDAPKPRLPAEERRQKRAQQRAQTRPLRREIERLDVEMQALTEDIAALDARLADNSIYEGDPKALNELLAEQGQLRARLADIETSWLDRQQRLEDAMIEAGN